MYSAKTVQLSLIPATTILRVTDKSKKAPSLDSKGRPAGSPDRVALSFAGDDAGSKRVVLELINALGFDGVDTGTLSDSWRQQPGAPAYCQDLKVEALKSALKQADKSKVHEYRHVANEQARPYFL